MDPPMVESHDSTPAAQQGIRAGFAVMLLMLEIELTSWGLYEWTWTANPVRRKGRYCSELGGGSGDLVEAPQYVNFMCTSRIIDPGSCKES